MSITTPPFLFSLIEGFEMNHFYGENVTIPETHRIAFYIYSLTT